MVQEGERLREEREEYYSLLHEIQQENMLYFSTNHLLQKLFKTFLKMHLKKSEVFQNFLFTV